MRFFFLLTVLLVPRFMHAQELRVCDSTHTYWVFGQDSNFFVIQVDGKAKASNRQNIISIDKYSLQGVIANKENFSKATDTSDLSPLIRYAMSESKQLGTAMKSTITPQLVKAPISSSKNVLLWSFDMPPGMNQQVKAQLFVNIVFGDKIFGLSCPQFNDQDYNKVRDFLMDAISSLTLIRTKTDLKVLCGH